MQGQPLTVQLFGVLWDLPKFIHEMWVNVRKDPSDFVSWMLLVCLTLYLPIGAISITAFALIFSPSWAMRKWTPRLYNALADTFDE